ncbi:hypothetical protein RF11_00863 [Thelohanellus kitauei]|uniref:Uncharacterized protein n=1 Tax=Thelohanellus kitauei TaxID=669202 RepID=A0A0C2MDE0_THEKT|nr:hypothetical protein RF11_00863 [Thelohanellus kitauei]
MDFVPVDLFRSKYFIPKTLLLACAKNPEAVGASVTEPQRGYSGIDLEIPALASSLREEVSNTPESSHLKRELKISIKGQSRYKILQSMPSIEFSENNGGSSQAEYEVRPIDSDQSDESSDSEKIPSKYELASEKSLEIHGNDWRDIKSEPQDEHAYEFERVSDAMLTSSRDSTSADMIQSLVKSDIVINSDSIGNDGLNLISEPQEEPSHGFDAVTATTSTSPFVSSPSDTNPAALLNDLDTGSQSTENAGVDSIQERSVEPAQRAKKGRPSTSTEQSSFAKLVKNPSAVESEIDADSQSTENDAKSLISEPAGDIESTARRATKKTTKTQKTCQNEIGSSFKSAEDYARYMIAKHAEDPSFGVDINGYPLNEEQMAGKIIEKSPPSLLTDLPTGFQSTGIDEVDITKERSTEPILMAKRASANKLTDQSEFSKLVKNTLAGETGNEVSSQSIENDGNSLISELSGDPGRVVDTGSTTISEAENVDMTQAMRQSELGASFKSAEDYARHIIAKHAKDPSFGIDKNGVPLSEEEMAARINKMVSKEQKSTKMPPPGPLGKHFVSRKTYRFYKNPAE